MTLWTRHSPNYFQAAREVLKDIKRRKSPVLVTHNGQPAAYLMDVNTYERLQKRMRILEDIARGEKAILEGRTLSHTECLNENES
jgi:prevent-host-death family protein